MLPMQLVYSLFEWGGYSVASTRK